MTDYKTKYLKYLTKYRIIENVEQDGGDPIIRYINQLIDSSDNKHIKEIHMASLKGIDDGIKPHLDLDTRTYGVKVIGDNVHLAEKIEGNYKKNYSYASGLYYFINNYVNIESVKTKYDSLRHPIIVVDGMNICGQYYILLIMAVWIICKLQPTPDLEKGIQYIKNIFNQISNHDEKIFIIKNIIPAFIHSIQTYTILCIFYQSEKSEFSNQDKVFYFGVPCMIDTKVDIRNLCYNSWGIDNDSDDIMIYLLLHFFDIKNIKNSGETPEIISVWSYDKYKWITDKDFVKKIKLIINNIQIRKSLPLDTTLKIQIRKSLSLDTNINILLECWNYGKIVKFGTYINNKFLTDVYKFIKDTTLVANLLQSPDYTLLKELCDSYELMISPKPIPISPPISSPILQPALSPILQPASRPISPQLIKYIPPHLRNKQNLISTRQQSSTLP